MERYVVLIEGLKNSPKNYGVRLESSWKMGLVAKKESILARLARNFEHAAAMQPSARNRKNSRRGIDTQKRNEELFSYQCSHQPPTRLSAHESHRINSGGFAGATTRVTRTRSAGISS